ncbi:hypothetical protein HanIR_Chr05g0237831 [Helianthus annuus]|nr:hypothetical protein HanIR_Chr05g0237831 [Helianthus annuus]
MLFTRSEGVLRRSTIHQKNYSQGIMRNLLQKACVVLQDQDRYSVCSNISIHFCNKETFGKFDDVLKPGCHRVHWILGIRLTSFLFSLMDIYYANCYKRIKR